MKVKVKGLVFAGFAAAVFAQSAMAAAPSQPTTADLKTVTSKAYVDSKFNGTAGQVIIQGTDRGDTTYKDVVTVGSGDNNQMIEANNAALPTVSAVKGYVDAAVASGGTAAIQTSVGANANDYVNFSKSGDTLTVEFDNAVVTAANGVTSTNDSHLITSGGVRDYAEAVANKQTSISSVDASNTTNYPTTGAVYSYAQDQSKRVEATLVPGTGDNPDTYTTTIDSSAANDTYPTTRNVYEFVTTQIAASDASANNSYQDKLTSGQTGLYVGTYSGNDSTWAALEAADTTNAHTASNYVTIKQNGNAYDIDLNSTLVGTTAASVTNGGANLMTGGGVYDYITTNTAGVGDNNGTPVANFAAANDSKFPTVANVRQYVTEQLHGNVIPAISSECTTAATNGGYCALVYGTSGLEWTVMAPAPAAQEP